MDRRWRVRSGTKPGESLCPEPIEDKANPNPNPNKQDKSHKTTLVKNGDPSHLAKATTGCWGANAGALPLSTLFHKA